MLRFYWLIDGVLAGCSLPGGAPPPDRNQGGQEQHDAYLAALEVDLTDLRQMGIGAILTLTEDPLPSNALRDQGLVGLHLPIPDMAAPLPHQFLAALDFIDRARLQGQGVAVHCLMGQGRTGAILAAYLIRGGVEAANAVARLRMLCPGALSSPPQERALTAFGARRDWIL